MEIYVSALKKYTEVEGRAGRKEYWTFIIFNFVVTVILSIIGALIKIPWLHMIYTLAILLPVFSVLVRRLHDINKSGWWILIFFIPLIGSLILLYYMLKDSQAGSNQYGPNPKGQEAVPTGATPTPQAPIEV